MFTCLKIGIRSQQATEFTAWKKRADAQIREVSQAMTDLQCRWHLDTLIFTWKVPTSSLNGGLIQHYRQRAATFVEGSEVVIQATEVWVEKAAA